MPLRNVRFSPWEQDFVSNFAFYSSKPLILAPNIGEEHLDAPAYPGMDEIHKTAQERPRRGALFRPGGRGDRIPDRQSREEFLKAYGLSQPGTARIAQAAYDALGLISFFTRNPEEVRA